MKRRISALVSTALVLCGACGSPSAGTGRSEATVASLDADREPGVGSVATSTTLRAAPATTTTTSAATTTTADEPIVCRDEPVQNDGFGDGSVLLTDAMRERLRRLADEAIALHYTGIELVGYADPRPVDAGSNESLSAARAEEAGRVLVGYGITAERISARGAGIDPTSDLHDPATWPRARRVDVRILC